MAIDLTGIQNVGEFYSHHYLDALLEKDLRGLFNQWKREDDDTPDNRLNRLATPFFKAKSDALLQGDPRQRFQPSHHIHVELLQALGYDYDFDVQYLRGGEAVPVLAAVKRDGHHYLWLVETTFVDPDEGVSPLDQRPLRAQYPPSDNGRYEIPREPWETIVGEVFRRDEPPRWLILFAGRYIYLIDRTKWGQGQYLLFDLDEIFGRRQLDTLRATAALLSRDSLCPDEGVPIHDTLDENSHKHAYAVSGDLKYGVRKAVELLANEYVWYQREIGHKALFQDDDLAKKLTNEALTYLYRLLFLFYAEARGGELGIVPMKSEAYRTGYSLESLRDLEQVPLNTPQAQNGYFIHESLNQLFKLVNDGHRPPERQLDLALAEGETPEYDDYGFSMDGLHSPLFSRDSTPLLSLAKFRNLVLQEVLQLLSLSKEGRGRNSDRGRISYAQLGINQLGAVYEGLLSYTGFFAQEDLFEVKPADAKAGDEKTQTYFIPESDAEKYKQEEFVYAASSNGKKVRKRHPKGSFIFRLAGRDREKSASYYTPEVLTQCVVKYSLKELLGEKPEDANWKTADKILQLTICEPAMGSGAFINEALNQLSDAYLQRKQDELGREIPPDDYREERQKVKAYIALTNVYGVDLNPMAVELAEVSLWLNIIYEGMPAPFFGARLAVGNSLIGARREVYNARDVLSGVYNKKAAKSAPLGKQRPIGSVYHWLLPDVSMAAFDRDKVMKELAPNEVEAIKTWRNKFTIKITQDELKIMQQLSDSADALWEQYIQERKELLDKTRAVVPIWGQKEEDPSFSTPQSNISVSQKNSTLAHLHRPSGPYRRLKLAMDYWCSLWFWPIRDANKLPDRSSFLDDLLAVLTTFVADYDFPPIQPAFLANSVTPRQKHLVESVSVSAQTLVGKRPGLAVALFNSERIYFHHWDLIYPEVSIARSGFDLILGNPPWIKLEWKERGLLSEYEPSIAVRKMRSSEVSKLRETVLQNMTASLDYEFEFTEINGMMEYFGANYWRLKGIQPNLYKCFINIAWDLSKIHGSIGLLHPIALFDDPKGSSFRSQIYLRLAFHYQFHNELQLFADVGHQFKYGVNIYRGQPSDGVSFIVISNLFHPSTVDSCFKHDSIGEIPGIKNANFGWELRGHRNRIINVDLSILKLYADIFDKPETNPDEARLPIVHSREIISVLKNLSLQSTNLGDFSSNYFATLMFDESAAQSKGIFQRTTRFPFSIKDWVVQGPHFFVSNPLYQTPNADCRSHQDYSAIDLKLIPEDYLPRTNFIIAWENGSFREVIPTWEGKPANEYFRIVASSMLNPVVERTLQASLLPPGPVHVSNVLGLSFNDNRLMAYVCGLMSSLPFDFWLKVTGKSRLRDDLARLMPIPESQKLSKSIIARTLRLNCLTNHFQSLWLTLFDEEFVNEDWSKSDNRLAGWDKLTPGWRYDHALRSPFERRQALIEIDVLASLVLGLHLEDLITIYRVQFPVLQKKESRVRFDYRGMEVPVRIQRGELIYKEDDPEFSTMVRPFDPVDRVADYREAWDYFEKRL